MSVESICGYILISTNPERLAKFYTEGMGLEFEKEDHGGLDIHYGTDIGQIHFGIHPASNFKNALASRSAVIAFNVKDFDARLEKLKAIGAEQIIETHDEGFGRTTTFKDPEGNFLEIVELHYNFGKKD